MESLEDDSIEDVDVGDDGSSSFAKTSSQDLDVGQADGCFCKISSNGKLSWLRIQESLRLLSQLSIAARKTRAPHSSPVDCAGPMSDPVRPSAPRHNNSNNVAHPGDRGDAGLHPTSELAPSTEEFKACEAALFIPSWEGAASKREQYQTTSDSEPTDAANKVHKSVRCTRWNVPVSKIRKRVKYRGICSTPRMSQATSLWGINRGFGINL